VTPIRVLVVDDSVVSRMIVAEAVSSDPDLELAGTAVDGRVALERIAELKPDVVVLDVEMPVMDGLEALKALRARDRRLPVVMLSSLTSKGASTTVDALTYGASDYVTKPSTGSRAESVAALQRELLPKLKALVGRHAPRPMSAPLAPRTRGGPVEAIVIGVSTGGPNALAAMLPALPHDLAVPVLVVQHMPPMFTKMLAQRLDALTALPVREAEGGEALAGGEVWIAPGGRHLVVERGGSGPRLALLDTPAENSCRPAVDVLFRSAADAYGARLLAVVMTGMGQDGYAGSRVVREAAGRVLAQDEESSVVWGMPRYVAEAGLADAVLPLDRIAGEISRLVNEGSRRAAVS
jgi:two-component system chemotaxis response regulator CheB